MVFEAPGGSAPAAERLARTRPGRMLQGPNSPDLWLDRGGGSCRLPEKGGATWWWGAAEGCPWVRPGPFVCPPRRSPLPRVGWLLGRREAPALVGGEGGRCGGEGERERALWGLGEAGGVEGQRPRQREAAGTAREGQEEKAEEGNPSCPQHPSVSCYQPKGAASGRGDRSR